MVQIVYQDLDRISLIVAARIQRQPRVRISTLFSLLRNQDRFSLIGDFPIGSEIIRVAGCRGREVSPKEVVQVFKQSDELKQYARVNNVLVQSLGIKL